MPEYEVPTLSFQSTTTRNRIIVAYWLVLILGLPFWWLTTSIERLSLPRTRVDIQTNANVQHVVNIALIADGFTMPHRLARDLDTRMKACAPRDVKFNIYSSRNDNIPKDMKYTVVLSNGDALPKIVSRTLEFSIGNGDRESLSENLGQFLCKLTVPFFSADDEHRTVQYSSQYRLAYSLLNEDASSGKSVLAWDAREAIHQFISPVTSTLSRTHNFSIETQLQLQAPLAFPLDQEQGHSVLSREQLTVFVNSAEWTLSSGITNDPVLHFLLFVPRPEHRPLMIEGLLDAPIGLHSFIIPRWGGVVIYNPPSDTKHEPFELSLDALSQPFGIFRVQLLQLLGLPENPLSSEGDITDWQLDALMRRRATENIRDTKQTLGSIVRLVDSIKNMPVGDIVTNDVNDALTYLSEAYEFAMKSSIVQALSNSAQSLKLSSRAFFQPTMLAMLYFPAEHTFAVYVPLFAPALMPLVVAAFKEFKSWRKRKYSSPGIRPKTE